MSIRESINNSPKRTAIVMSVCVVATVGYAAFVASGGSTGSASLPSQMYFSADDGKTYFADDSARIPPFDHYGKQAHLAGVFRCPGKQPFVAYVLRYSPEGAAELAKIPASLRISADPAVNAIKASTAEAKRPGAKAWTPATADAFGALLVPACPHGHAEVPEQVLP